MAQRDHFERLVAEKRGELTVGLVNVPANEVHRVAMLQGGCKMLDVALELYRQAHRVDADGDQA